MSKIQCFLLEPTDRVSQRLRRYMSPVPDEAPCPAESNRFDYHNAEVPIEEAPAIWDEKREHIRNSVENRAQYDNDTRWPTHCACGYQFTEDDPKQLFVDLIYRRVDTGEELTLRETPAGAMWRSAWWRVEQSQDDGAPLFVKLPDGAEWCIDNAANNCTIPDDWKQEQHHCWPRRGTPPDVDVDKRYGPTCSAGAGSIATSNYHGYLRHGWLESC